MYYWIAVIR